MIFVVNILALFLCSCSDRQEGNAPVASGVMGPEAPMLAAMVAAGTLPPLKERLPANPLVVKTFEGIGRYGGTLRRTWQGMASPWDLYFLACEPLLRYSANGSETVPNLAESLETFDGGRAYVLHLRRGIRWSDGVPFTADDVLFAFEDVLLNEDLTPAYPRKFEAGGKPPKVQKIDDWTVRYEADSTSKCNTFHQVLHLEVESAGAVG